MDGKTKAIVAHVTWVGWLIAFIVNNSEKDEFASYYIRQQLGLILTLMCYWMAAFAMGIMGGFIPFVGILVALFLIFLNMAVGIGAFVFWLISLIGAINGEERPVPWLGEYYQKWFGSL